MLSLGHEVRLGCRDGRDGSVEHPLGPKTHRGARSRSSTTTARAPLALCVPAGIFPFPLHFNLPSPSTRIRLPCKAMGTASGPASPLRYHLLSSNKV